MVGSKTGDKPPFSVVVEMENAAMVSAQEWGEILELLAEQIGEQTQRMPGRPEVIIVHAGAADENAAIAARIEQQVPALLAVSDLQLVSLPEGRYYELKNAGVERARGEVIVMLDSDAFPRPGWLTALLSGFTNPETMVVGGHTYLGHSGFLSRTLALVWVFPLREGDLRSVSRRALNVNNCAFRGSWIRANPIPIDNGFKVGCTKLMHQMQQAGVTMHRAEALCEHKPLQGWRFLVWRAMVTGRDADRKYADLKSPSRLRRLLSALKFSFKMQCRAVRRILTLRHRVAMPIWEVPAALAIGCTFYGLAFLGQLQRVAGLDVERPEHVPAYVESH